jgi:hypothetical protein
MVRQTVRRACMATLVVCSVPLLASAQTRGTGTRTDTDTREAAPRRTSTSRSSPGLISKRERVRWFVEETAGPGALSASAASAAWDTSHESPTTPSAYGSGWKGFGSRYAVRIGDNALRNSLEASLGAIWHEDPRYVRSRGHRGALGRVGHAARMTVLAPRPGGRLAPSYARYAGLAGGGLLANIWHPADERSARDTILRSTSGLAGTFASNVFQEFWPDIRRRFARHLGR